MENFGGIEAPYNTLDTAGILLQPIGYDGTCTWGKGTANALAPFLEASANMELYDIETDSEVYKKGIHILPEIREANSPEDVFKRVYASTIDLLNTDKYLTFLGGEHSISIGIIKAFYEKYSRLTVLQLDAHADLRKTHMGSPYNHACAMHDASQNTNLIQIGIRSMDSEEKQHLDRSKCYFAQDIYSQQKWMDESIQQMTDDVYLTFDVDVLDPSIMPSTGTPEPGGLNWDTTLCYLKKVFAERNVVGFDIVELAPHKQNKAPDFLIAKLYYKMLSYKFYHNE